MTNIVIVVTVRMHRRVRLGRMIILGVGDKDKIMVEAIRMMKR